VTDRARFYFNTGVTVDTGNIGTYDEDLSLQTAGTTRISVLNSNGNVGIGSTSPGVKLDVTGAIRSSTGLTVSSGRVDIGSTGSNYAAASGDWNFNLLINSQDTSSIGFHDSGHSVGMIKYLGNLFTIGGDAGWGAATVYMPGSVGIGTASPSQLLHVNGTAYATTFLHTSDRRLKTDIEPAGHALDTAAKLRGVHFRWKKDGKPSFGVIAQEVEAVMPDAVTTNPDGMKAVDYDQLIPILIEAVKELKAANDNEAAEITRLREEIEALKRRQGR
jgi:hypothetical protein